jgi:NitT/TauT family transport system substrate-binding protein
MILFRAGSGGRIFLGGVLTVAILAAIIFGFFYRAGINPRAVRYGITPYQDSALPVVAEKKGWYREDGITVELVPLEWGDAITALSSGSIDVVIYNLNSFLAPYENAAKKSPKPIFYAPLYLFKGQAIMVHAQAGFQTFVPATGSGDASSEVARIAAQLKGKRIALTKGTELEQIVLAALEKAGLKESEVTIIHASPADSLAGFLANDVDAFAAGLTERTEARRRGAVELLTQADVMLPVIDGLVTTEEFAAKNRDMLDKLVLNWFKTVRYIGEDIPKNSEEIREYLRTTASTRYSPDEYAIAWTFNVFPANAQEADNLFNKKGSIANWKTSWDYISKFLMDQKKISAVPPYQAYVGETTLARLAGTAKQQ